LIAIGISGNIVKKVG